MNGCPRFRDAPLLETIFDPGCAQLPPPDGTIAYVIEGERVAVVAILRAGRDVAELQSA